MPGAPNICVLIPVYNHGLTVGAVVRGARAEFPVIVVNDGSTDSTSAVLAAEPGIIRVDLPVNQGKAEALKAGFAKALELGYTHAITMDADGQHPVSALAGFAQSCRETPESLIVGVRDLKAEGAPWARRATNDLSTFWFRFETGATLRDTQCGFRVYPLERIRDIRVRSGHYAYELEIMALAAWIGIPLRAHPVRADYSAATSRMSHFKPGRDFLEISRVHNRLCFLTFCLPVPARALIGMGTLGSMPWRQRFVAVLKPALAEHTGAPSRLAAAVGLGLFCGIAPIWGAQMLAAAALAHRFRLNKFIALMASNVSFPLAAPFVLAAGLWVGHWTWTGEWLRWDVHQAAKQIPAYFFQWFFGSWILAAVTGALGSALAYGAARAFRGMRGPGSETAAHE